MISITSIEFLTDIGLSVDIDYFKRPDLSSYECHPSSENSKESYTSLKKATSRDEILNIMRSWKWFKINRGYSYNKQKRKFVKDSGYILTKYKLVKEGKGYMIFESDDFDAGYDDSARSQIRVRFREYNPD